MGLTPTLHTVLLVDDEPRILTGLQRQLRGLFEVLVAESAAEALAILSGDAPVSILVTDMRMPVTDGATLCSLVRARFPQVVRIILSGQSDFAASLKAVNEGQIFRFLTKPVDRDYLLDVLREATTIHDRQTEEKRILQETLHGAIEALSEVLAVADPVVFGRATRLRHLVREFCSRCGINDWWETEVAAVFSEVGWVTVPPETIARFDAGEPLSPNEASMVKGLLEVPNRILGRIPRLDAVRETIRYSSKHFDGTGQPDGPGGEHIPWGSRVLCLLRDLSQLETRGKSAEEAVEILSQRQGRYDPSLLDDLRVYVGSDGAEHNLREVSLAELRVGHRFVEPVLAQNGVLLVARGQTATDDLITRLENFSRSVGIREPLTVAVPVRTPATGTDG